MLKSEINLSRCCISSSTPHRALVRLFRLNEDLLGTIRAGSETAPKLKEFRRRVRIIFGASDPYLNRGVAQRFHELFPASDLFLLPSARYFVQMDEPEEVARLILSTPEDPT